MRLSFLFLTGVKVAVWPCEGIGADLRSKNRLPLHSTTLPETSVISPVMAFEGVQLQNQIVKAIKIISFRVVGRMVYGFK